MTTQVAYSAVVVWLIGPFLVLTAFGVALFRRDRTLAAALIVLGFAAALIGGIANALATYEMSYVYRSSGALAAADVRFHGWVWSLARFGGTGGMWVASLSLLWHLLGARGAPSPNNRWRGP
jgi:hypothetical protein